MTMQLNHMTIINPKIKQISFEYYLLVFYGKMWSFISIIDSLGSVELKINFCFYMLILFGNGVFYSLEKSSKYYFNSKTDGLYEKKRVNAFRPNRRRQFLSDANVVGRRMVIGLLDVTQLRSQVVNRSMGTLRTLYDHHSLPRSSDEKP